MMAAAQSSDAPTDTARGAGHRARVHLLEDAIEPVVRAMGYVLVHVEWAGGSGRRRLQLFVDRPEGGIGLEDCTRLSPIVGNALDAAEAADPAGELARTLASPYVLEVSSPGLERPLSRRSQFSRSVGQTAKIRTYAPVGDVADQRNFHGCIDAVEPDPMHADDDRRGTVVLTEHDRGTQVRIPLSLIRRAHLVYQEA
jgi:ribosome maturation factor RimP